MSYAPIPMVPGPVALHEDVIAVLGRDYGSGQVESDFLCLYDAASRGIGKLMGTKDDVVLMTGEGMLALWGALKSCLKPGDHVVSVGTGVFGDGIGEMAESFGCIVEKVSLPYDCSIRESDLAAVEEAIRRVHEAMPDVLLCAGTVLTTEMCLLSAGRNPDKSKEEIEKMLLDYLGCEKVLWIKDGIDPDETNGHIDDVACFIASGEVACIWTEDKNHPFYEQAQAAYRFLSEATDAKGRKLKVHKLCLTKKPCLLEGADTIDAVEGTIPREDGEVSIASYMNFLIVNGAVILPQYGDENDAVAIEQVQKMFPDREVVGVQTKEVAFGGGNIHCITQQQPAVKK